MKPPVATLGIPQQVDLNVLVKEAKNFASECTITKDGKTKKLTQLMMLMSLGVKQGDTVTVAANGEDEDAAIETLKAFFEANL